MSDRPHHLTVNDRSRPLGVTGGPRFGWHYPPDLAAQRAYRIRVGTGADPATSDDSLWDSGRVDSAAQECRPYEGPALRPGTTYRWQVRVWDVTGRLSPWSDAAEFGAGLRDEDWEAAWIRRAPAVPEARQADGSVRVDPGDTVTAGPPLSTGGTVEFTVRVERGGATWQLGGPGTAGEQAGEHRAEGAGEHRVQHRTAGGRLTLRGSPGALATYHDVRIDGTLVEDWHAEPRVEPDQYTLARVEFTPGTGPIAGARLYLSAYHQYEARIDGVVVDRGPAYSYAGEGYYQATDVTELLGPGRRSALAVSCHWEGSGQGRPEAEPGLLARLVVAHSDGTRDVLVSDGSWRVRAGAWFEGPLRNGEGDHVECFDARRDPLGWDRPGFDDAGWAAPEVLGRHPIEAFGPLTGQEPRLAFETVSPVSVQTLPSGAVVADFGRVIPAVPRVDFHRGRAGRVVELLAGYLLDADGSVSRTHGIQKTDMAFCYVQRDGVQRFEPSTYLGFRYLEVGAPGEPLASGDIAAVLQHTDVDPARTGALETSDPMLDRVFALMRDSALGSTQHQFLDTPTREKGQFLADSITEGGATMRVFGERCVTRKAILEFGASQRRYWPDGRVNAVYPNGDGKRDIPDFTTMFPGWVRDYYLHSGDRDLVADSYPVVRNIAEYLMRHVDADTGLIVRLTGGGGRYLYGLVDWPVSMRYGYDMEVAARTTVNLLAVDALAATSRLARVTGVDAEEAARFARAAADLASAVNDRLRRADGVYTDGLHDDGSVSAHASQIANAYALCFGVVPTAAREAVGRHVADLGLAMGPMTARRLIEALCVCGRTDAALRVLTASETIGWGAILARGGTFTWECWDAREIGQSESHGWGAGAVVPLIEHLVGVRVVEPGGARLAIRVPAGGLDRARATLPIQRGEVTVAWSRGEGGAVSLDVDLPPNTTAEARLPGGTVTEIGAGRTRLRE